MLSSCQACNQPIQPGDGCTIATFDDLEAGPWKRIPCASKQCHDCKVARGQFHHVGCDVETCPACGGLANSCDCDQLDGETDEAEEALADTAKPEKVEHTEPEPVDPIHRGWETSE